MVREDKDSAMLMLNIDSDMADLFGNLTTRNMTDLASSNQLLCNPAFKDAEKLKAVLGNTRERGLTETHVAMLLASAEPTGLPGGVAKQ
jgi:flagellar transcriptional activator FlhD